MVKFGILLSTELDYFDKKIFLAIFGAKKGLNWFKMVFFSYLRHSKGTIGTMSYFMIISESNH